MYTAISATSETLMEYLRQQLAADISFFTDGSMIVTLNNPQEMVERGRQGLSLWLYRIVRDEERLNAPPERVSRTERRAVPLPIRLHYLMTPLVNIEDDESPLTEQTVLGRVLQAMHDRPRLRGVDLQGDLAGTQVELYTRIEPLGLDEITRVWEALDRSYQLSVSYEVSVVYIHSQHALMDAAPVEVVMPEYGAVKGSEPL